VTTPAATPLLETHPAVRRVIPYDKKGRDRGVAGLFRLARALRAEQYEMRVSSAIGLCERRWRHGSPAFRSGWVSTTAGGRSIPTSGPRATQGHEIDRVLALAARAPPCPPGTARHAGRSRGDGGVPARARHPRPIRRARAGIDLGLEALAVLQRAGGAIGGEGGDPGRRRAGRCRPGLGDHHDGGAGGVVRRPVGAAD